jgi:hypothetical protein
MQFTQLEVIVTQGTGTTLLDSTRFAMAYLV